MSGEEKTGTLRYGRFRTKPVEDGPVFDRLIFMPSIYDGAVETSTSSPAAKAVIRRVAWRILPLMLLLYFIAYLDRVNIGFAANAMRRDLGFDKTLFGLGSGIFFFGYLVAQMPSNLALQKLGARRWIALLMGVWGVISGALAFTHSPKSFLVLRFLLGLAEAGFYPGVIYYLSIWLPQKFRTELLAWFIFAIPLANILGGPVSSYILHYGAIGPFADWQVLLLVECTPAIVMSFFIPFLMTDLPTDARWLSDTERAVLLEAIREGEPPQSAEKTDKLAIFRSIPAYQFCVVYFTMQIGMYGLVFWLPQMLADMGVGQLQVGWTVAAVFLIAAGFMFFWSRLADRKGQPIWALSGCIAISAVGWLFVIGASRLHGTLGFVLLILSFALAEGGVLAATTTVWAAVSAQFAGGLAALAIGLINALGNMGGFFGPSLLGWLATRGKGYDSGMLVTAGLLLLGSWMAVVVQKRRVQPV